MDSGAGAKLLQPMQVGAASSHSTAGTALPPSKNIMMHSTWNSLKPKGGYVTSASMFLKGGMSVNNFKQIEQIKEDRAKRESYKG